MSFNWNAHAVATDYVKFDNPGDTVSGVITAVTEHTWPDGSTVPKVHLTTDDGDETSFNLSQIQLRQKVVSAAPDLGSHISVTYTHSEARAGGKTLKHFDVQVTPAGGTVQPQAVPAPAPAAPPTPAPAPAAQPAAQQDPWAGQPATPAASAAAPADGLAEQVQKLAAGGFTDQQIADFLKVDVAQVAAAKA